MKGVGPRSGASGSDRNRRSRTGSSGSRNASGGRAFRSGRTTRAGDGRANASSPSQVTTSAQRAERTSRAWQNVQSAEVRSGQRAAKTAADATMSGQGRVHGASLRLRRLLASPRLRRFGLSVLGAHGVVLLMIVSVALIGVVVSGVGLAPLPASIAEVWLVLNLAPFRFNGTTLELVPALPAVAMVAFIAWRVRREVAGRISIRDVRALIGAYLGTPVALTVIAWLMLYDASKVFPRVQTPNIWASLAATIVVHLIALVLGMGQRLLRALLIRRGLPEWILSSARMAGSYVAWLWMAGAVVVVASLIWHHDLVAQTYGITDTTGEKVALTALSLFYLPNAAFGAAGVLVGGDAVFGPAEVGLFAVRPARLPSLPILAAMPQSLMHWAFGLLIIFPALIAVWRVVRALRGGGLKQPYLTVVFAAVWAGVFMMAFSWLLGGVAGIYGWVGANWWLTGLLGSIWLVVPGAIVVVATTGLPTAPGGKMEAAVSGDGDAPKPDAETGVADAAEANGSEAGEADAEEGRSSDVVEGEVVASTEADGAAEAEHDDGAAEAEHEDAEADAEAETDETT